MASDVFAWASSASIGAAVAVLSYADRGYFAHGLDLVERDMADKLRRLRASTPNLRKYLVGWLIVIGCTFFGLGLGLDKLIFAGLLSAFLAAAPWYVLRRMAERHRQKIEDQLADSMVTLANAVRAGLSLAQSMEILASQCPRPINAEFHQIVAEYNLGKPLDRTLTEAKERLKSENFALFAAAIMASHESGGRLERNGRADRPVGPRNAAAGAESAFRNSPGAEVGRLYGDCPGPDSADLLLRRSGEHHDVVHQDRRTTPVDAGRNLQRGCVLVGAGHP